MKTENYVSLSCRRVVRPAQPALPHKTNKSTAKLPWTGLKVHHRASHNRMTPVTSNHPYTSLERGNAK